ncbi:MAG TPA: CaiB/BaiF CoA-transferase family protein [Methylomirabilota bacterium]|nr:CaiB/BaiF CoA-transferase family protein [Methylomirabilota bacterium]
MTALARPPDELPLAGYTVLDLTRVLAGPYCTRILADMGARVIKIERPVEGDDMRRNYMQLEPGRTDQSSYFTRVNAGKESVAIDMAKPEGQSVIHELARRADVFVENFMPGVAAKLGCDESTLRAFKPDLVYCSISGFGQTGPWRARPAFAHIINAASGLMHLEQGDEAAPRASNLQAADVLAGTHAVGAIVGALLRRGRSGKGAHLDVSMLEALISADSVTYAAVLNGGEEAGNPRPGMVVAAIGDRALAMQFVGSGELWPRLLALMRRPELGKDPRFETADGRRANWRALRDIVVGWLQSTYPSVDAALAALAQARIPCAPVLRPAELVAEPHLAERGFFPAVPHPARGTVRVTSTPYHLDHRPLGPRGPAAYRVGEHTRDVLSRDLGYSAERIEALRRAGIVDVP